MFKLPRIRTKGFTLIELMVAIAIIAVLAVIGMVIMSGIQKNSRDARRKADIDAIAASMEANYGKYTTGQYSALCQNSTTPTYDCGAWFSAGTIPTDPNSAQKYCYVTTGTCTGVTTDTGLANGTPPGGSGVWILCAGLEAGGTYCRRGQQ